MRIPLVLSLLLPLLAPVLPATPMPSMQPSPTPTATFKVTFTATWSASTHPYQFPAGAHFSPLVGTTHSKTVSFWRRGALAAAGIERMAEQGATTPLSTEIGAAVTAGSASGVILGSGIGSPGSTSVTFTTSLAHKRLTLVSMVAPSPDWFVGVSGLRLFEQGDWIRTRTVQLFAQDAGTDDGAIYTSPDLEPAKHRRIRKLTSPPFDTRLPLGTFTIERVDAAN